MDFSKVEIGVNTNELENYLDKIKSEVITSASDMLTNKQEDLFNVFRANWKGVSEANFEENMRNATVSVQDSLNAHFNALSQKLHAVNNSWVNQDEQMVQIQGGNN